MGVCTLNLEKQQNTETTGESLYFKKLCTGEDLYYKSRKGEKYRKLQMRGYTLNPERSQSTENCR